MSEQEQNKKINEHNRRITKLEEEIKTLKLDVEPQEWISDAFEAKVSPGTVRRGVGGIMVVCPARVTPGNVKNVV